MAHHAPRPAVTINETNPPNRALIPIIRPTPLVKLLSRLLSGSFLIFILASAALAAAPDRELKTTPVMKLETRYLVHGSTSAASA